MEVKHIMLLKTDLTSEVLANNALPSRMEIVVKDLLQFSCQVNIGLAALFIHLQLYEFNCLQFHVCYTKVLVKQKETLPSLMLQASILIFLSLI